MLSVRRMWWLHRAGLGAGALHSTVKVAGFPTHLERAMLADCGLRVGKGPPGDCLRLASTSGSWGRVLWEDGGTGSTPRNPLCFRTLAIA